MHTPAFVRVLTCVLVAGCALVDQKTFAPAPEARAHTTKAPPLAVRVDPRAPLASIAFGGPPPDYAALLRYAVHEAQRRDGAVQFDVIAVVPDLAEATVGQQDAIGVMRSMTQFGVPEGHLYLGVQADPALKSREVRVYVR